MSYQLTGKVKLIGEIEQKSQTFKLRKFVVTINGETKYPQHIELQASNDKCEIISKYAIGSDVIVHFNLRGREWISPSNEVKHFISLDAWKIEDAVQIQQVQQESQQNQIPQNQIPVDLNESEEFDNSDDLPF